jgi:hypothetical protein
MPGELDASMPRGVLSRRGSVLRVTPVTHTSRARPQSSSQRKSTQVDERLLLSGSVWDRLHPARAAY